MKPSKAVKSAAKLGWDTFEDLGIEQLGKPILNSGLNQLEGFFASNRFGSRPKEMAKDDLKHAREEKRLEEMKHEAEKKTKERLAAVKSQYSTFEHQENKQQGELHQKVTELTEEVVKMAKAAGVETNIHLEQRPRRLGIMDIVRLTAIVRFLRIQADSARSGSDLVSERSNSKRATGMMAWVSGKQMKIHEQGTLQLQG